MDRLHMARAGSPGPTRRGIVAAVLGAAGAKRTANRAEATGRDRGARRDGRCGARRANCGSPERPDCRNLNRDPAHCGACGQACPPGHRCAAGVCRPDDRCQPAPVQGYRLLATHPHDRAAFTQGLAFADGVLYEGTGLHGRSSLRAVDLASGRVLRQRRLPDRFFGEGIAVLGDRIFQLTWQAGRCFVVDRATFAPLATFSYRGEGWGLAAAGDRLVMSNGSATLSFRDAADFSETGRLTVRDGDAPVSQLNELEWVDGELWANVWFADRIARIDPATGCVRGWLDLAGILSEDARGGQPVDVLNGIAHDAATGRVFVTGKLWPALFEIAPEPGPS